MKHRLLIIFLATLCAVTSFGQTIKTLGYNTTNGQVVYSGTNVLNFTNQIRFGETNDGWLLTSSGLQHSGGFILDTEGNSIVGGGLTIGFGSAIGFGGTNEVLFASTTRTNLGLGATWLTNANVTNFRTAIGLGAADNVTFSGGTFNGQVTFNEDVYAGYIELFFGTNGIQLSSGGISFSGTAATTRTNLGLGLPALTNTSNVTAMRALAGSTNTNQPFSGSFNVTDDNSTTRTIVVSNGIIVSADEY
jgi:hypothetical protein